MIINKDRNILRELARKQFEYSQLDQMKQKVLKWKDHNNFRKAHPMIHLELWTFKEEIIPDLLRCEGETARKIEEKLYLNFLNYEIFDDDKIVPDHFPVTWDTYFILFGHEIETEHSTNSDGNNLGHRFKYVLSDLHDDFDKLGKTKFGVNRDKTKETIALLESIFGDILPVKLVTNCLYSVPTQNVVHLMGMENMLFSIVDYPEEFLKMMERIADDTLDYYKFLADEKLLLSTVESESLAQGTLCYTDELPGKDVLSQRSFIAKDIWGFMDSQETVSISPAMFEEFIFPCYKRIAESYGLLSYGCCEPVHPVWDSCISKLSNLRKVSVSPWCDEQFMGDRLRGKNIVFQRKPSPNYVGVGTVLDEEAVKAHINATIHAAQGCYLEFTQRDVYSINHDIPKAKRYVEIIRECIELNYKF